MDPPKQILLINIVEIKLTRGGPVPIVVQCRILSLNDHVKSTDIGILGHRCGLHVGFWIHLGALSCGSVVEVDRLGYGHLLLLHGS